MTVSHPVRPIEVDDAPVRYARGWHCLGLVKDFADGTPHAVQAFGGKLVVWADSAGELKVLDAFCRHMGGDLSRGTVKGDEIACPFHDWRWGGDGRCKKIPYAKRVPLRARTATWPTMVQDDLLFVWNDPEGNPPPADVTIPVVRTSPEEWTEWVWISTTVEGSHCREVIDNVVDMAHFFYVHYSVPTYFRNVFEGHVATQVMKNVPRQDVLPASKRNLEVEPEPSSSDASYHGPSFMIDALTYPSPGGDIDTVLVNCHYPVTKDSFVLQYGLTVRRTGAVQGPAADAVAARMIEFIRTGFEQDVAIWRNKAPIDNPLLCEEDGPVYQLRRWYQQFYVDVADVQPEMVDRFEFELDLTRPNQAWRAEVEANIARQDHERSAKAIPVAEQPA